MEREEMLRIIDTADLIKQQAAENAELNEKHWGECRQISAYDAELKERGKMRCENCVFWKDRQIQQSDGTCRNYAANDEMFVTIEKGINIGEHCAKHGLEDETKSWFWAQADDFCSRFKAKESE